MTRLTPRLTAAALAAGLTAAAAASTLTFNVPAHEIIVGKGKKTSGLRVVLTDETVQASVMLDVYSLPNVPQTKRHLQDLQSLPRDTWWKEISWQLRDSAGRLLPVTPRLVGNSVKNGAGDAKWRQTPTDLRTYRASFDLGHLPPGDYSLQTMIRGLTSSKMSIAVRTGNEPDVRDHVQKFRKKGRR